MEISSNLINRINVILSEAVMTIENQRRRIEDLQRTERAYNILAAAVRAGDPDRFGNGEGVYASSDIAWHARDITETLQSAIDTDNQAAKQAAYDAEKVRFDVRYADHERRPPLAEAEGAQQNETDGAAESVLGQAFTKDATDTSGLERTYTGTGIAPGHSRDLDD